LRVDRRTPRLPIHPHRQQSSVPSSTLSTHSQQPKLVELGVEQRNCERPSGGYPPFHSRPFVIPCGIAAAAHLAASPARLRSPRLVVANDRRCRRAAAFPFLQQSARQRQLGLRIWRKAANHDRRAAVRAFFDANVFCRRLFAHASIARQDLRLGSFLKANHCLQCGLRPSTAIAVPAS
jgi:hypothetical protein